MTDRAFKRMKFHFVCNWPITSISLLKLNHHKPVISLLWNVDCGYKLDDDWWLPKFEHLRTRGSPSKWVKFVRVFSMDSPWYKLLQDTLVLNKFHVLYYKLTRFFKINKTTGVESWLKNGPPKISEIYILKLISQVASLFGWQLN